MMPWPRSEAAKAPALPPTPAPATLFQRVSSGLWPIGKATLLNTSGRSAETGERS